MPTEAEYVARIRTLDRSGLLDLLRRVQDRDVGEWAIGKAFEYLVVRAFELESASVQYPYEVRIFGHEVEQVDGAVHIDGLSALIESKDYTSRLNVAPIAKLRNQLMRRPAASIGMLFSEEGFTQPALILSLFLSPQTILIWQGEEIEYALRNGDMVGGMKRKYRYAVEHGLPDYNLKSKALR